MQGWLLSRRGASFRGAYRLQEAIASFTEAIKLNQSDAWSLYERAAAYARLGDYRRAEIDFAESIRLDPSDSFAWDERGDLWKQQGDFAKALDYYREADKLMLGRADTPETSQYAISIAWAYALKGNLLDARQTVQNRLLTVQRDKEARENDVYSLLSTLAHLDELDLALQPANADPAQVDHLEAQVRTSWEAAEKVLNKIKQPSHASLADVSLGLRRIEVAEDHARKQLADWPESPEAWLTLAEVFAAREQRSEAIACIINAVSYEYYDAASLRRRSRFKPLLKT